MKVFFYSSKPDEYSHYWNSHWQDIIYYLYSYCILNPSSLLIKEPNDAIQDFYSITLHKCKYKYQFVRRVVLYKLIPVYKPTIFNKAQAIPNTSRPIPPPPPPPPPPNVDKTLIIYYNPC
jgi:hypothetical protein